MDKIVRIRYSLLGKIKRPLEILLIGMDDLEYSLPSFMKYTMPAGFSMGQIYCSGVKML